MSLLSGEEKAKIQDLQEEIAVLGRKAKENAKYLEELGEEDSIREAELEKLREENLRLEKEQLRGLEQAKEEKQSDQTKIKFLQEEVKELEKARAENREFKKEAKRARRSDFQVKSEQLDHQIADINDKREEMIQKAAGIGKLSAPLLLRKMAREATGHSYQHPQVSHCNYGNKSKPEFWQRVDHYHYHYEIQSDDQKGSLLSTSQDSDSGSDSKLPDETLPSPTTETEQEEEASLEGHYVDGNSAFGQSPTPSVEQCQEDEAPDEPKPSPKLPEEPPQVIQSLEKEDPVMDPSQSEKAPSVDGNPPKNSEIPSTECEATNNAAGGDGKEAALIKGNTGGSFAFIFFLLFFAIFMSLFTNILSIVGGYESMPAVYVPASMEWSYSDAQDVWIH